MSLCVMSSYLVRGGQSTCFTALMHLLQWGRRKSQFCKERGWMVDAKANKRHELTILSSL